MSLTVTLTPALVAGVLYVVVAIAVAFAGIVEQSSFVNPRYGEVLLAGAVWPWLLFQVLYAKATGRYFVKDVKRYL